MAPPQHQRKRPRRYFACCSYLVKNIRSKLLEEKKASRILVSTTRVTDRLASYTCMSAATIQRMLRSDSLPNAADSEQRKREVEMDREDEMKIRPAIVYLVRNKITPTLDRIVSTIRENDADFKWGRSSVQRALSRIGFSFTGKRHCYYDRLREDPENICRRIAYLERRRAWLAEGRQMVYMDESWINQNCSTRKSWSDGTPETVDTIPPGKGPRWIMIGAGTKDGWIEGSFKMWKGNVQSEDYHTEMNGDVFKDWMHEHLLPNVQPNAVIVIDRASYHLQLRESSKAAPVSQRKVILVEWLLQHGSKSPDGVVYSAEDLNAMSKATLKAMGITMKPKKMYLVFDWVADWNASKGTDIKINVLPAAHPTLNPIELVWCWLKGYVARNNHAYTMPAIRELALARVQQLGPQFWYKAVAHSNKYVVCYEEYEEADEVDEADAQQHEENDGEHQEDDGDHQEDDDEQQEEEDDRGGFEIAVDEYAMEPHEDAFGSPCAGTSVGSSVGAAGGSSVSQEPPTPSDVDLNSSSLYGCLQRFMSNFVQ